MNKIYQVIESSATRLPVVVSELVHHKGMASQRQGIRRRKAIAFCAFFMLFSTGFVCTAQAEEQNTPKNPPQETTLGGKNMVGVNITGNPDNTTQHNLGKYEANNDKEKSYSSGNVTWGGIKFWDFREQSEDDFSLADYANKATGINSTAFGRKTTASNYNATAFGDSTEASGFGATAFGNGTRATRSYATSFGLNTVAGGKYGGDYATAFGKETKATEFLATAWGEGTGAWGERSTAFGYKTEAHWADSTAWGNSSKATGTRGTAFGYGTEARGYNSTS